MNARKAHSVADIETWQAAKALDAQARALVLDAVPEALVDLPAARRDTFAERRALQLVATAHSPAAIDLYRQADALYWRLVERAQTLVRRYAHEHAKKSRTDVDAVLSVAQEGAFRGAIAWDPERGAFSTALRWHVMSAWQRAPDRQGAVMLGSGARMRAEGGFGRVAMMSVDAPMGADEDGGTMLDMLAAPDVDLDTQVDSARVHEALHALDARERAVLIGRFNHDESNERIGERLDLSRERVRQISNTAMRKVRAHMEQKMEAKRTGRPRAPVSAATMDTIHQLREEGQGLRAISQVTGIERSTVGRLLKREAEEPPIRWTPGESLRPAPIDTVEVPAENAAESVPSVRPVDSTRASPCASARSVPDIVAAITAATGRLSVGEAKVREGERLIAEARTTLRGLHEELGEALGIRT